MGAGLLAQARPSKRHPQIKCRRSQVICAGATWENVICQIVFMHTASSFKEWNRAHFPCTSISALFMTDLHIHRPHAPETSNTSGSSRYMTMLQAHTARLHEMPTQKLPTVQDQ